MLTDQISIALLIRAEFLDGSSSDSEILSVEGEALSSNLE